MFLGRAHTAGDVVAYIPSERVVDTGDLMHGLLPFMGDGFLDELRPGWNDGRSGALGPASGSDTTR
jgi:hypothetical protein